jgi:ribosomal protein L21E
MCVVQVEGKVGEVKGQQEKCYSVDRLLKSLDEDVEKQITDLQHEQKAFSDLKEAKIKAS